MNIYQRMMMQSLTPQQVAAAAFGARAVAAPTVVKTDVQALFNRGSKARSVMNVHLPYVLGRGVSGLDGLGEPVASVRIPLLGPTIGFNHPWAAEWYRPGSPEHAHVTFWKLGDWEYPESYVFDRAKAKVTAYENAIRAGNTAAEQEYIFLTSAIMRLTKQADTLVQSNWDPVTLVSNDAAHRSLADTYNSLTQAIKALANSTVPPPQEAAAPPSTQVPSGGTPGTDWKPSATWQSGRDWKPPPGTVTLPSTGTAQGAITARSGLPSWLLPAGVGVALIGGFFLLRKKG